MNEQEISLIEEIIKLSLTKTEAIDRIKRVFSSRHEDTI
jgi:hypothetical protein